MKSQPTTIDSIQLDTVTGGFAFLLPLLGAAAGAVAGGTSKGGKFDWKEAGRGALGSIGLGGLMPADKPKEGEQAPA